MNKKNVIWLAVIIFLIYIMDKGVETIIHTNEGYLKQLNSSAASTFRNFIKDIETKLGYKVTITSGFRTYEKQAELKKQDARNASAGTSAHEFGNALDLILTKNGKTINKSTVPAIWRATGVLQLAKKHGLNWGGNFPNYYDPVHFYI